MIVALAALLLAASGYRTVTGRWQAGPIAIGALLCVVAAMTPRPFSFWIMGLAAVFAAAGALLLWLMPAPQFPRPTGPHRVGLNIFALGEGDNRVLLYAWTPTTSTGRFGPHHTPAEQRAAEAAMQMVGGVGYLISHFRFARSWAIRKADIANTPGGWPLLVFNHGAVSPPTQSTSLMSELASHGYAAVSIGHPGESSGLAWPDGTVETLKRAVIDALTGPNAQAPAFIRMRNSQDPAERWAALGEAIPAMSQSYPALATVRWRDVTLWVVDQLLSDTPPESVRRLATTLSKGPVGYLGFSLGGSVAQACCMADPRAGAGVNLDGLNWRFEDIGKSIPTPFLNLAGAGPDATPVTLMGNEYFYEPLDQAGLRPDVLRYLVKGANHGDFTDGALMAREPLRRKLGGGQVEGREMVKLVNATCRGFLDWKIKGVVGGFPANVEARFKPLIRQDLSTFRAWAVQLGKHQRS